MVIQDRKIRKREVVCFVRDTGQRYLIKESSPSKGNKRE